MTTNHRTGSASRATKEATIEVSIDLDGSGVTDISTGVPFYDHMLDQIGRHGGFDLTVKADGDVHVDAHHTVEDTGLALGQALARALGDRTGIERFGHAYAPLDEALARAVVDLSGRPYCVTDFGLRREFVGKLSCENVPHFMRSLATTMMVTLHVDVLRGENDHHRVAA